MRRRRNPITLCDLDNPRRWHKKTIRRSWKHRDRFHDAVDDVAWERAARRRKSNPLPTRRNCNMTFLSQEQEDRIVSRIATARNPAGGKRAVHRWWRGLSKQKRMKVAKSVLGRMNPRSHRNPKRDGSPTRGEKRAVKRVEYLRTIIARSEDARLEYQRLTATVAKAGAEIHKPTGPRALRHAAKVHAEEWEAEHEAQSAPEMSHHTGQFTAPSVAAVVAEHPELKFVTSRLSDIDITIAHLRDEIKELPDDDLSEDEEARLMEEISKLARQKQKLRDKLTEIQPAMSNPRHRRGSRGRISSRTLSLLRTAAGRAQRACKQLRAALRRA